MSILLVEELGNNDEFSSRNLVLGQLLEPDGEASDSSGRSMKLGKPLASGHLGLPQIILPQLHGALSRAVFSCRDFLTIGVRDKIEPCIVHNSSIRKVA